jgi:hypothetical protein
MKKGLRKGKQGITLPLAWSHHEWTRLLRLLHEIGLPRRQRQFLFHCSSDKSPVKPEKRLGNKKNYRRKSGSGFAYESQLLKKPSSQWSSI